MTKCSFSPTDASVACVSGKDNIKFFRISDREVRSLQETNLEGHNFTSHVWLRVPEDHLVAGTDTGDLLLFRSGEYVCHLSCAGSRPVHSLLPLAQGFIAGSIDAHFTLFNYVRDEDDISSNYANAFSADRSWSTDLASGAVVSMAISPNEELICAVTSDNQMLTIPAVSPNTISGELVRHLTCSFPSQKSITGMDICYRKPLIITTSKDNSLRIWNFQMLDLELNKNFPEEMLCCAIHPSGLHAAVGFADKLRVFHILVDDLRPCLELSIKNCRECRFSNGGNMLAAANGNTIHVYDFYSGDKIADLRGHNGKVRSIFWLDSGAHILSCGQDGAVYLWEIDGAKRTSEFVHKGTMYTSAVCANDSVFVVGSDRMLKELELPDMGLTKELDEGGSLLTLLAISPAKSVLFASTSDGNKPGVVRAYTYPVTGDYLEYPCMTSGISRMGVSPDQGYLVVTDDSGCICVFELTDRAERYQRMSGGESLTQPEWFDEVLVTRVELEDRNQTILELKTKVDELERHNEYQLKLKDMNYSEKIKEVTDKFAQELEQAKAKLEILKEERADSEFEYIQRHKQKEEKHQHDLQETETEYQTKIMEEVEKYQQLVRMRDAQLERLNAQRQLLIATHERYVEELTADFDHKIDEERQLRLQLDDEKAETQRELTEIHRQLEDDVDTEIENMRQQYDDKLRTSREATLKYKGENGIMRKKFAVLQKEIEDQKDEIKTLLEKEKELHDQVKVLEKEVSAHKREIKSRDASIGDKEKRIYELKKKNQELDKFKFVLDFKIRELKRQVEPRQAEIAAMKDQIKQMDSELEKYHKSNAGLDEMIGSLRERIDALQNEIVSKRMKATQLEHFNAGFKGDLQRAVTLIQNPVLLTDAVQKLVATYGSSETIKSRADPEVEGEYDRHKQFLMKSVAQMKKALNEEMAEHGQTNSTLRNDNMKLITQINEQREKNKLTKQDVQAGIGTLQHLLRAAGGKRKSNASEQPDEFSVEYATRLRSASEDPMDKLERNRIKIAVLREKVSLLEGRFVAQRAYSREVLPPMDGTRSDALPPMMG